MFCRGVGVLISMDSFLANLEELVIGVTVIAEQAGESGEPGTKSSSSCTLVSGLKCCRRGEYVGLCWTRGERSLEAPRVTESRAFQPVVVRALGVCCGRFGRPLDGVADGLALSCRAFLGGMLTVTFDFFDAGAFSCSSASA